MNRLANACKPLVSSRKTAERALSGCRPTGTFDPVRFAARVGGSAALRVAPGIPSYAERNVRDMA
jgi:hypothetical protein